MNLKLALLAAGLAVASSGASAAIVTLSGATVDFSFDNSFLSQVNSKYNGWDLVGNELSFLPNDLYADSGSKPVVFAQIPSIKIVAKSGYAIDNLRLQEDGYYFQTENAEVSAYAGFTVNGVLNPFSASIGEEEFDKWSIDQTVNLDSVKEAKFKVLNILKAKLTNGTDFDFAYIDKNSVKISANTSTIIAPVPVPGAIWMFGSAFAGFLVSRRSKQA